MKLTDLCANLVPTLKLPMSEFTELLRALKEGSSHFDENSEVNIKAREAAAMKLGPNILKAKPGPGGGLDADPFRTAFVLVALMINGPRKEAAKNTWLAWHLPQAGSVSSGWVGETEPSFAECPLTGCHLFGEAFRTILDDQDLAARIDSIRISANSEAAIHYDDGKVSVFEEGHGPKQFLYRIAVLDGIVVQSVSQLLKREG